MDKKIIISADGGSRGNDRLKSIAGYGVVMVFGEHRKEYSEGFLGATNNQMEIQAVTKGLSMIKNPSHPVEVQSDSAYVINAINKSWIEKWITNGWLKSNKQAVENVDLWKELWEQYCRFNFITFVKVKGHSGDPLNDRADELANIAMDNKEKELKEKAGTLQTPENEEKAVSDLMRSEVERLKRERTIYLFEQLRSASQRIYNLSNIFQNEVPSYPKEHIVAFEEEVDRAIEIIDFLKNESVTHMEEF